MVASLAPSSFSNPYISYALTVLLPFEQIIPLFFPADHSILLHTVAMGNEDASTVAGAILIVLGIVTVASRFYSRWFTKAGFGWDDWTILIAMLTSILPGALTIWGAFFCIVCPSFPHPIESDQILYRYYVCRLYTCMPCAERANKTDAPFSKQRIRDGARRRRQQV